MYFKVSLRHNPAKDTIEGYYRLVESYRDDRGRVSHSGDFGASPPTFTGKKSEKRALNNKEKV
jgi:hypothetical protein